MKDSQSSRQQFDDSGRMTSHSSITGLWKSCRQFGSRPVIDHEGVSACRSDELSTLTFFWFRAPYFAALFHVRVHHSGDASKATPRNISWAIQSTEVIFNCDKRRSSYSAAKLNRKYRPGESHAVEDPCGLTRVLYPERC